MVWEGPALRPRCPPAASSAPLQRDSLANNNKHPPPQLLLPQCVARTLVALLPSSAPLRCSAPPHLQLPPLLPLQLPLQLQPQPPLVPLVAPPPLPQQLPLQPPAVGTAVLLLPRPRLAVPPLRSPN